MRLCVTISAAFLPLAIGCRDAVSTPPAQYAVYGAVVDALFRDGRAEVAVAPTSSRWDAAEVLGDTSAMFVALHDSAGVSRDVWADFERANRAADPLCDCFGTPGIRLAVPAVPADSVGPPATAAGGDRWRPVHLSGVGFNARGDTALVFASQACGPLCGRSFLLLVARRGRTWGVAQRLLVGAS